MDTAENKDSIQKQNPVKEIIKGLEEKMTEFMNGDKYKTFLNTMSAFHHYSVNNTLLIASQRPDATYVAGFEVWKNKFQRHVNKGEKGIDIIAPMPYKKTVERDVIDSQTNEPMLNPDGTHKKEEVEITIPKFQVVKVFDVKQTSGKPLPELGVSELTNKVDGYKDLLTALEKVAPVPVEYADIESGAKGYFSSQDQKIVVQNGMGEAQTVKTMIHEISHSLVDDKNNHRVEIDNQDNRNRNEAEVTSESVSYVVCQHFGIDTSDYSFGYIAGWSSGMEMAELKGSLDAIQKISDKLIYGIEKTISEIDKEREASLENSVLANNVKEEVVPAESKPEIKSEEQPATKTEEPKKEKAEMKPVEKKEPDNKKIPTKSDKQSLKARLKEKKDEVAKTDAKKDVAKEKTKGKSAGKEDL